MVVRLLDPATPGAEMPVVAGSTGIVQQGSAQGLAVNAPAGLAAKPGGGIIFAEIGSHTVKALLNGRIELVAGGRSGSSGEGSLAVGAALVTPTGLAYDRQGNLWILESFSPRLLRVSPDGQIATMAGTGLTATLRGAAPPLEAVRTPGRSLQMGRPVSLAIGPDDRPYWIDQAYNGLFRLAPDGQAELIAGKLPLIYDKGSDGGDGGPAAEAAFNFPTGLAFDKQGNLYLADTLNFRVRKIAMNEPGRPITTIAGLPAVTTLGMLLAGGGYRPTEGAAAGEQLLVLPGHLCMDNLDRLYLAEVGTARLGSLLGSSGKALPDGLPRIPSRIRRINLLGPRLPIQTIAGPGGTVLTAATGDDSPGLPLGLLIDGEGRLALSDALYNQVKVIPAAALN
jgi:hypothetical protein